MCDECGSHDVQAVSVDGHRLQECGLCGHLQGEERWVRRLLEQRRAAELGVPTQLLGFVEALDSVPELAVEHSISLVAGPGTPPAIFFSLRRRPLEVLERLLRSLVLACRSTSTLWTVEATHQGRLMFVLRPRLFHSAGDVTEAESRQLIRDLAVLRDALRRDLQLPWWELGED